MTKNNSSELIYINNIQYAYILCAAVSMKIAFVLCFTKDMMSLLLTTLTLKNTCVSNNCFVVCTGFPDVLNFTFVYFFFNYTICCAAVVYSYLFNNKKIKWRIYRLLLAKKTHIGLPVWRGKYSVLVSIAVDPEPISGAVGTRWEYTCDPVGHQFS